MNIRVLPKVAGGFAPPNMLPPLLPNAPPELVFSGFPKRPLPPPLLVAPNALVPAPGVAPNADVPAFDPPPKLPKPVAGLFCPNMPPPVFAVFVEPKPGVEPKPPGAGVAAEPNMGLA